MMAAVPVGLRVAAGLRLLILPHFGWRVLFAVGVLPALLLFFVARFMPESVRYLLSRGRIDDARRAVEHIEAAAGVKSAAPVARDIKPEVGTKPGITVLQLFAGGRARRTVLFGVVSFCVPWSSHRILVMLLTLPPQPGVPL